MKDKIKKTILDEQSDLDSISITRPVVSVDGEIVEYVSFETDTVDIKGKTLDVYYFLIKNNGYHGVREIQRALGYTSPNLALYHLKKLIDAKAITKNEFGQYGIEKDEVKLGTMENHINFLAFWIPRTIIFSGILFILGLFGIIYLIFDLSIVVYSIIFISTCFTLAGILIHDSSKMVNKYQKNDGDNEQNIQNQPEFLKNSLSQALSLMKSTRAKDRFQAQGILEEIIKIDTQKGEISTLAMINLCDILLDELKLYGRTEVLNEVIDLSTEVYLIAVEQNSVMLSIETLLLQHKFELISGRLDSAKDKLELALGIAQEQGIENLKEQIINEMTAYEDQLEKWINPVNINIKQKIVEAHLMEYIDRAREIIRSQ